MSEHKDLEKELWDQINNVIGTYSEDFFAAMCYADNDKAIKRFDEEDLILGLSGLDSEALDRVNNRKILIEEAKRAKEETKKYTAGVFKRIGA